MKVNILTFTDGRCGIRVALSEKQHLDFMLVGVTDGAVAQCVRDQVDQQFETRIKEIRIAAYERGRRSVRNKEQRVESFNGCVNSDWVGS